MLALLVAAAINLYAGDASAQAGYVHGSGEDARIRGHLVFIHDMLAAADVSALTPELRAEREKNLARLLRYARAGQFPRNDDHPDARRPTFVDAHGHICAVGALYASDRGFPAAERVAQRFKYAYIVEIDDPDLAGWQRTSGLTTQELALIQPSYGWEDRYDSESRPIELWQPFGLTDRQQHGHSRIAISQEVTTADNFATTTTTFYGHTRNVYIAMPLTYAIDEDDAMVAAAGGAQRSERSRLAYGNADAGLFWGKEHDDGTATVYRLGALLPTATDPLGPHPGMRVGDVVTELPRSYGMRLSSSRIVGWNGGDVPFAVRFDYGVDYARNSEDAERMYLVPRAALGFLVRKHFATVSFDTAVAHVFDEDVKGSLLWSGGTTVRLTTPCGFQPALTFAAVRTPEGWSGAFALELAMSFKERGRAR